MKLIGLLGLLTVVVSATLDSGVTNFHSIESWTEEALGFCGAGIDPGWRCFDDEEEFGLSDFIFDYPLVAAFPSAIDNDYYCLLEWMGRILLEEAVGIRIEGAPNMSPTEQDNCDGTRASLCFRATFGKGFDDLDETYSSTITANPDRVMDAGSIGFTDALSLWIPNEVVDTMRSEHEAFFLQEVLDVCEGAGLCLSWRSLLSPSMVEIFKGGWDLIDEKGDLFVDKAGWGECNIFANALSLRTLFGNGDPCERSNLGVPPCQLDHVERIVDMTCPGSTPPPTPEPEPCSPGAGFGGGSGGGGSGEGSGGGSQGGGR